MVIEVKGKYQLIKKPNTLFGLKCFACKRRMASEEHHCLSGRADRQKCDEDGLTVALCSSCHWEVHNNTGTGLYHKLKKVAQKVYEEIHTREEWMARYNKNYLWDEE